MDSIDTQSLLLQMRSLTAQAKIEQPTGPQALDKVDGAPADFSELLSESINTVNRQQKASGEMKQAFEKGDPNVDLAEVMLQAQKASLSFQAMTEVRNKLVDAYKQVTQMPL